MDRDEYDEDAFVRHLDALGVPHALRAGDARRLGLDRNTEEGALLAFSSSLRADRPGHRVVAWVLLAAFGIPVLLALLHWSEALLGLLVG
jgi:hypothetical protein